MAWTKHRICCLHETVSMWIDYVILTFTLLLILCWKKTRVWIWESKGMSVLIEPKWQNMSGFQYVKTPEQPDRCSAPWKICFEIFVLYDKFVSMQCRYCEITLRLKTSRVSLVYILSKFSVLWYEICITLSFIFLSFWGFHQSFVILRVQICL